MNKRGQIYLLVALILALVLYMLMTRTNIIYEYEIIDDFETLSRNYDIEASNFMNEVVIKNIDKGNIPGIGGEFDTFTGDFTKYATNQNPDFGLIYVFDYGDYLYIGNYMKIPIIIGDIDPIWLEGCIDLSTGGSIAQQVSLDMKFYGSGCWVAIPSTDKLEITIGNTLYDIIVSKDRPEIIIVSREEKGEQRKVYTKNEFVGGAPEDKDPVSGNDFCGRIKDDDEKRDLYSTKGVCSNNKISCNIIKFKESCVMNDNCCWDGKKCKPIGECEE